MEFCQCAARVVYEWQKSPKSEFSHIFLIELVLSPFRPMESDSPYWASQQSSFSHQDITSNAAVLVQTPTLDVLQTGASGLA